MPNEKAGRNLQESAEIEAIENVKV